MWVLYVPVVFKHLECSLRVGSPFFFLQVNPGMGKGFILSDPKSEQLKQLPEALRPKTILWLPDTSPEALESRLAEKGMTYPLILKPDIGFRGLKVNLIMDHSDFVALSAEITVPYLIQEYIDLPEELGVFWYRYPNANRGVVPSLTLKAFMEVMGDGRQTLKELVAADPRWRLQRQRIKEQFGHRWEEVLQDGERLLLEPVGNHNRGTMFVNGTHLVGPKLEARMQEITELLPGFFFGRLDMKVRSLDDFINGGEVKVLEVNGVGAEPTHVYHPGYSLFKAWKEMAHLWGVMAGIALEHRKNGHDFPDFSEAKARYLQYRRYKKEAL